MTCVCWAGGLCHHILLLFASQSLFPGDLHQWDLLWLFGKEARAVPALCRALGLVLWLVAWAQLPRLLLRSGPEALRSWVLIPWKGRTVLWKRRAGLGWEVWLLPCLRSLVEWMFGAELSVVSVMYGCVVAQWELHKGDYSKKKKKKEAENAVLPWKLFVCFVQFLL